MFPVRQLYDLQLVDSEISSRRNRLAEIQARLEDDSSIQSLTRNIQRYDAYLDEKGALRRTAEFEVQQLEQRIESIDARLMSGSVTNSREVAAYQEQRAMLQRQKAEHEEPLLELMVEIEERQTQRSTLHGRLTRAQTVRSAEVAEHTAERNAIESQLIELVNQRSAAAAEIDPAALSLYESVFRTRGGQAVARVERGICQGCRIAVPNRELLLARASDRAVQCGSCRRILYVE
jgi:hypothetical protein